MNKEKIDSRVENPQKPIKNIDTRDIDTKTFSPSSESQSYKSNTKDPSVKNASTSTSSSYIEKQPIEDDYVSSKANSDTSNLSQMKDDIKNKRKDNSHPEANNSNINSMKENASQDSNSLSSEEKGFDVKSEDKSNLAQDKDEKISQEDIVKKLENQIEELKASWSKERAEFINFRKRKQLEYNKNRENWISSFVSELIPSMENLERVLTTETESKELQQFIQGVGMIKDGILKVFQNHRVKLLSPVPRKDPFNPYTMEAISVESAEKLEVSENTILEVYQPAYILESDEQEDVKVIQSAKVKIAINQEKKEDKA